MDKILHQLIGSSSHYLQGFIHPRWCRISSINSMVLPSLFLQLLFQNHFSRTLQPEASIGGESQEENNSPARRHRRLQRGSNWRRDDGSVQLRVSLTVTSLSCLVCKWKMSICCNMSTWACMKITDCCLVVMFEALMFLSLQSVSAK